MRITGLLVCMLSVAALADDWELKTYNKYGIEFKLPVNSTVETREWKGGWAGLKAVGAGEKVTLHVVTKKGGEIEKNRREAEIKSFVEELTGIDRKAWDERFELVHEGSNSQGAKWHKAYRGFNKKQGMTYHVMYGEGPEGAYLAILTSPIGHVKENEATFKEWFDSIRVFKSE